jgi:tetratricopeptide (TPR) repeat protein
MQSSRPFSHYKTLLILCFVALSTTGCSALLARTSKESYNGRGIRITEVWHGSPGERTGLKTIDVIFRYGDFEVVDDASYFVARDAYENRHEREVSISVWRQGEVLKITVPPGKLGIVTTDHSEVATQIASVMIKVDAKQRIPEYMRDGAYKTTYLSLAKTIEEAKDVIDQAEREGTLTPAQILVARIYMIPDDASPEDLKRQSDLLAQLVSTQPASYLEMLGQDRFFKNKHYRAAIECFKRHLEVHPDDVSLRLNMGYAQSSLGMYAESEAAADYVLDHKLSLSDHGYAVAYQLKAMSALSRRDYDGTIALSHKAFEIEPYDFDVARAMLAAAQTGDLKTLAAASRQLKKTLPVEFEKKKLEFAAVEALALVKSNQPDRARELTREWKDTDRIEGRLKSYWKVYPGGSDIWTNWNELTRN